jgi:hypothetical protein
MKRGQVNVKLMPHQLKRVSLLIVKTKLTWRSTHVLLLTAIRYDQ